MDALFIVQFMKNSASNHHLEPLLTDCNNFLMDALDSD